jgi:hypothetical protein
MGTQYRGLILDTLMYQTRILHPVIHIGHVGRFCTDCILSLTLLPPWLGPAAAVSYYVLLTQSDGVGCGRPHQSTRIVQGHGAQRNT